MGTHPIHPGYAGIPTFFQAPYGELDAVREGMTVVAGVPIDQGIITAKPGTRYGPRAIREASQAPRGRPGSERGAHLGRRRHRRRPASEGPPGPGGRRGLRHRPHRHHEDDVVGGGRRGSDREARRVAGRPGRRPLHRVPVLRGLRPRDERAEGEPPRRLPARRHALGLPLRVRAPRPLQPRDLGPAGQREPRRLVPEHGLARPERQRARRRDVPDVQARAPQDGDRQDDPGAGRRRRRCAR